VDVQHQVEMALCSNCDRFDIHSFSADSQKWLRRGYSLEAVKEATRKDCNFCSFLMKHCEVDLAEYKSKYRANPWFHLEMRPNETTKTSSQLLGYNYTQLYVTVGEIRMAECIRHRVFELFADPGML
jgi:hypothetical protein